MKKIFSVFVTLTVLISAMNVNALANDIEFSDTAGHWAESTINKWANYGIISGYPDGTFKPDSPVTRAELAKILTLAFDLQSSEFVYSDRDLSEEAWYYNYLLCAGKYIPNYALPEINEKNQPYVDNRMVNSFLPEQNAMRMHVAEGLVEIKRNKEQSIIDVPDITAVKEELNKTFKDADYEDLLANHGMIPENVRRMFEYTYLAKELDIMQGDTDGYFRPYDNVTRAELITMLDRLMYYKLSDFIPKDIIVISYQELDYPNGIWDLEQDKMNGILQIFSEIKLIPNSKIRKPFEGYSFAISSPTNPTMVYIRDNASVTVKNSDGFVGHYILSDSKYVEKIKEIMKSTEE